MHFTRYKGDFFTTYFRAAIERRVLNLPEIEPLDMERLRRPLGPGYDNAMPDPMKDPNWDLYPRVKDCDLSRDNCVWITGCNL